MAKTLVVIGYGPGISHAVAQRFARAGFQVALVARSADKLAAAAKTLSGQGVKAQGFAADASDPTSVRQAVQKAREALGDLSVLHWNAATPLAGDLLTASAEELVKTLQSTAVGLVCAVQEALPDLRKASDAAVLVTNGAFGLPVDAVDAMAVQSKSMGLAVGNAAKHKTVRLLATQLEPERIFVGEVMVAGIVKGTAWDRGQATLEAGHIAEKFWELYEGRTQRYVQVG